jgi:uncharacterized repeat protein (TIGR03803 family)
MVQGTDGNLYGGTGGGGAYGFGTIFEVTPSGILTTLHSFCEQATPTCPDGYMPLGNLVMAKDGTLYGTTSEGGAGSTTNFFGGTIFRLAPNGTFTTLYSFCVQSGCPDGWSPNGLVQASNGNLYGTTTFGGTDDAGTVFEISPDGTFTTLYRFCTAPSCPDGFAPNPLVPAADGDLYGTTTYGGDGAYGNGTIFKITLSGTLTTLYNFCVQSGCPDGEDPYGSLTQATNGDLYGVTLFGGAYGSSSSGGTIFKVTPSGTQTTLYSFCAENYCLESPAGGLVQANDGNLYGMGKGLSGATDYGGIYKITPGGDLTIIYDFGGNPEGYPIANLVQGTNGDLYGSTGPYSPDVADIFSLSVGLNPFVATLPTSGKPGSVVTILGTDLTGATRVSFNGTGTKFKVVSASAIETVVPTGATTGTVEVTTPSGTLSSNKSFRVE